MAKTCLVQFADEGGQSITSRREAREAAEKALETEILKQARALMKKWNSIFGLQDWTIRLKMYPSGVLVTPSGEAVCMGTECNKGSKTAVIRIDYQYNWNDKDGHNGFEQTFVHELLHIVTVEMGVDFLKDTMVGDEALRWNQFEEDHIDRLANILIRALDKHN